MILVVLNFNSKDHSFGNDLHLLPSDIFSNVNILFGRLLATKTYVLDHNSSASLYGVLCQKEILSA